MRRRVSSREYTLSNASIQRASQPTAPYIRLRGGAAGAVAGWGVEGGLGGGIGAGVVVGRREFVNVILVGDESVLFLRRRRRRGLGRQGDQWRELGKEVERSETMDERGVDGGDTTRRRQALWSHHRVQGRRRGTLWVGSEAVATC